jgi:GxxExxY protein
MPDRKHVEITGKVIGAFFKVYNTLGYGFNEKVYENALAIELRKAGLKTVKQPESVVYYDGEGVGDFRADIIVNDVAIVELKAARELAEKHEANSSTISKPQQAKWVCFSTSELRPSTSAKAATTNAKAR